MKAQVTSKVSSGRIPQPHSFIFLLTFVLFGAFIVAQAATQGGIKKPRQPEDYSSRTLQEIFSGKPDRDDLQDKQGRLVVTRNTLPSAVQVTYTGSIRTIPPLKKEVIRQWARLYAGSMEHYTARYQREMLFREKGRKYWLAVPEKSRLFEPGFRKGESLTLYLTRPGATIVRGAYHWTLLIEDFRVSERTETAVEMKFVQMRPAKPPLVNLIFDVILRNNQAAPRWFLLPSNLGASFSRIGDKGGVDGVEVYVPNKSRVKIGRFFGTGGFHALLLPANALVRLRRFPISYWGDPPNDLLIDIVVARRLLLGKQTAAQWFGGNPLSSRGADVSEDAVSAWRVVHSKSTPDKKELEPRIEVERRVELRVSLRSKN